ncbi:MAG: hypothetical protein ABI634_03510 [Acidobacteriota bacterium]
MNLKSGDGWSREWPRLAAMMVSLAIPTACGRPDSGAARLQQTDAGAAQAGPATPALIVLKGASRLRDGQGRHGGHELSYRLQVAYPAEEVLRKIHESIAAMPATPLEHEFLNPGLATGVRRGWSTFIDGSRTPSTRVTAWVGEWQTTGSDVVIYSLRYDSAVGPSRAGDERPDNDDLLVSASFIPAAAAAAVRKQIGITAPIK